MVIGVPLAKNDLSLTLGSAYPSAKSERGAANNASANPSNSFGTALFIGRLLSNCKTLIVPPISRKAISSHLALCYPPLSFLTIMNQPFSCRFSDERLSASFQYRYRFFPKPAPPLNKIRPPSVVESGVEASSMQRCQRLRRHP